MMVQIKLPDGSVKEFPEGVRPREVAEGIGKRLAEAAVAAVADGTVVDLDRPLENGSGRPIELRLLTPRDREALDVLRHSTAHIMARAILRLFPGARLAFGPTTATGFYYDVDLPGDRSLSEDDFPAIEAEMARIVKQAEPFERFSLPVPDARQFCRRPRPDATRSSTSTTSCTSTASSASTARGSSSTSAAGRTSPTPARSARSSSSRSPGPTGRATPTSQMLQRVYGTAFFDKKDLDAYLAQVEEAKKRDHRKLGKELGLFTISPLVGSGLILWMPKGAIVRGVLENFLKDELIKRGYQPVYTPHIGKIELYQTQRPLSVLQGLAVPAAPAARATPRWRWSAASRRTSSTTRAEGPAGQGGHPRADAARVKEPRARCSRSAVDGATGRSTRPGGSSTSRSTA